LCRTDPHIYALHPVHALPYNLWIVAAEGDFVQQAGKDAPFEGASVKVEFREFRSDKAAVSKICAYNGRTT
jgi:hypothetical protein